MHRQPFEVISSLMDRMDILLVTGEIAYEQWVDGYSVFDSLGWSEKEFYLELDNRWVATTFLS